MGGFGDGDTLARRRQAGKGKTVRVFSHEGFVIRGETDDGKAATGRRHGWFLASTRFVGGTAIGGAEDAAPRNR